MTHPLRLVCLGLMALLTPSLGTTQQPALNESQGNAERGHKLFDAYNCWLCHGREAQGGGAFGPRLGPNVVPFIVLQTYVRAPAGDMPPFTGKVISDQDLLDIWTYINSVPTPPPVQSIALLNQ